MPSRSIQSVKHQHELTKGIHMNQQKSDPSVSKVAMNLEVHVIPVSDVERAKQFYQRLGWRPDEDVAPAKNVRIVQFTPPGSGCSVTFGNGVTASAPGTAVGASATGTLNCVDAWIEDFRQDIARNTVPTLILHGDADRILPPDASARRQAKMIKNVRFVELKGGPHGVPWTHAEEVNSELVKFLA
jgi:pimeloyl-ACP methyl ester carboxylesterase